MKRNHAYWGQDLPSRRGLFNFDEIEILYFRDSSALFEAFKGGLVDFREETSAARWKSEYAFPSIRDGGVQLETIRPARPVGMEGFAFNLRRPVFADVRLRKRWR